MQRTELAGLRRILVGALCATLGFFAAGCVSSAEHAGLTQLRWPEPPQLTRIEHVQDLRSPADLGSGPTTWERLVRFLVGAGPSFRAIGHPSDIEISSDSQRMYVADFAQGLVHVFDLEGKTGWYLGESKRFRRPFGLALDSEERLYVVEQAAPHVRVIDEAGNTLRIFGGDNLIRPTDIEVDTARGRVYVVDASRQYSSAHCVQIFDLDGDHLGRVGLGKGAGEGQLMFPTYLALDAEGNLYVADTLNSRVSVFAPDGTFLRMIGQRGDGVGMFDKPKGVAFDSFGNLYVADSSWSNVQIFGPRDDVLLFFGGRGAYPGLLNNPTGVAIAPGTNTIYVGDYLNHRIEVYRLINTQLGDGLPEQAGVASTRKGGKK